MQAWNLPGIINCPDFERNPSSVVTEVTLADAEAKIRDGLVRKRKRQK